MRDGALNIIEQLSGDATANFVYDPLGRRASKTINSVATQFAYDGNDIVAELGGGAVGANYLRSLNIDEPFIRQAGTGNEHYHTDALGSSLALSNAQGASATTYTYEAFGKTTLTGMSPNPFQFTGRENDGTGLYYYRARYYSPLSYRFLSEDLAREDGGINLYVYARNNPANYFDPTGFTTWPGSGPVTSGFETPQRPDHHGIDIANSLGAPVVASDDGIVSGNGTGMNKGPHGENQAVIDHPGDGTSGYAHVTLIVVPGQVVKEGQVIGYTDNSGNATGSGHVHYTFKRCPGCKKEDPRNHLPTENNYPKSNRPSFPRK